MSIVTQTIKREVFDIVIDAGTDYFLETTYVDYVTNLPINITGYTADLKVRPFRESPVLLLEMSTANGRILLNGPSGGVTAHFLPADTAPASQITAWNEGVYDLLLTDPNGIVVRLLRGKVIVLGTVSL